MSQIIKNVNTGDLPPQVALQYITDSGTAVPIANTLYIIAGQSTVNSGSTVLFTGSGNTAELNVTDANFNTIIGKNAGNASLAQEFNTGLGYQAMDLLISGEQIPRSAQTLSPRLRNALVIPRLAVMRWLLSIMHHFPNRIIARQLAQMLCKMQHKRINALLAELAPYNQPQQLNFVAHLVTEHFQLIYRAVHRLLSA